MECLQQRGSLPADTLNQVAEKPVGSVAGVTSAPGAAVGSSGVSISSAVQALDANASANGTPTGYCARYVRQALAAGGLTSFDTNHPAAAKDYGPYLEKAGFSTVNQSGYTPQAGDVIVYQPTSASSQYGHIQMYDGKNWVSDWKQPRMVPGASYQSASYTIFRG